ncbi:hypothetical protein BDY24DRAFT_162960 [Mrakia frigida]|uniref:uncharacterized protein n=1 Tax=Mrakia frigida TaxID=29902 RepID=UPI003FCBFD90
MEFNQIDGLGDATFVPFGKVGRCSFQALRSSFELSTDFSPPLSLSLPFPCRSSSSRPSEPGGTRPTPSRSLPRTNPSLEEVQVELSHPRTDNNPTSSSTLTTADLNLQPRLLDLEGLRREEDPVLEEVEEEERRGEAARLGGRPQPSERCPAS